MAHWWVVLYLFLLENHRFPLGLALMFSRAFFPGVWEYIEKTRDMVHDLEKRVQSAKDNVDSMSQLMTEWAKAPLYERKEGKNEGLLNLEVNSPACPLCGPTYRVRNASQQLSSWPLEELQDSLPSSVVSALWLVRGRKVRWFTRTVQAQAQATCEPGRRKRKRAFLFLALVLASYL